MRRRGFLRRRYGGSPFHLLLTACSFAVALYAGLRLLGGDTGEVLAWFAGAAVLHDLVLLPLYSLADHALRRATGGRPRAVGHLRVPAFVSGVLALVWGPLVFAPPARFAAVTGRPATGYLENWLLTTAALFGASALLFLARAVRPRRRRTRNPGD